MTLVDLTGTQNVHSKWFKEAQLESKEAQKSLYRLIGDNWDSNEIKESQLESKEFLGAHMDLKGCTAAH